MNQAAFQNFQQTMKTFKQTQKKSGVQMKTISPELHSSQLAFTGMQMTTQQRQLNSSLKLANRQLEIKQQVGVQESFELQEQNQVLQNKIKYLEQQLLLADGKLDITSTLVKSKYIKENMEIQQLNEEHRTLTFNYEKAERRNQIQQQQIVDMESQITSFQDVIKSLEGLIETQKQIVADKDALIRQQSSENKQQLIVLQQKELKNQNLTQENASAQSQNHSLKQEVASLKKQLIQQNNSLCNAALAALDNLNKKTRSLAQEQELFQELLEREAPNYQQIYYEFTANNEEFGAVSRAIVERGIAETRTSGQQTTASSRIIKQLNQQIDAQNSELQNSREMNARLLSAANEANVALSQVESKQFRRVEALEEELKQAQKELSVQKRAYETRIEQLIDQQGKDLVSITKSQQDQIKELNDQVDLLKEPAVVSGASSAVSETVQLLEGLKSKLASIDSLDNVEQLQSLLDGIKAELEVLKSLPAQPPPVQGNADVHSFDNFTELIQTKLKKIDVNSLHIDDQVAEVLEKQAEFVRAVQYFAAAK